MCNVIYLNSPEELGYDFLSSLSSLSTVNNIYHYLCPNMKKALVFLVLLYPFWMKRCKQINTIRGY